MWQGRAWNRYAHLPQVGGHWYALCSSCSHFPLGASKFSCFNLQSHSQPCLLKGGKAKWSFEAKEIFNLLISGTRSDGIIKKKKKKKSGTIRFSAQGSWVQSWTCLFWRKNKGQDVWEGLRVLMESGSDTDAGASLSWMISSGRFTGAADW